MKSGHRRHVWRVSPPGGRVARGVSPGEVGTSPLAPRSSSAAYFEGSGHVTVTAVAPQPFSASSSHCLVRLRQSALRSRRTLRRSSAIKATSEGNRHLRPSLASLPLDRHQLRLRHWVFQSQRASELPQLLIGTPVEQIIHTNSHHLDVAIVGGEYVAADNREGGRNCK